MGQRYSVQFWLSALCWGVLTACGTDPPVVEAPPSPTPTQTAPATTAPPASSDSEEAAVSDPAATERPTALADTDTLVIPGERVGPVTRETSRADLVARFGEAALTDAEIPVGEGFTESGTTVYAGTDHAFSIIWVDSRQARPATIKDLGRAWQTPEGIHVGTSFADLKQILGSFSLYGFGWDYQGTVVLEGSNLAEYYGELILRLQPDATAIAEHPEAYTALQGDRLFSADNPNLDRLDLSVDQMIVYLNSPAP